MQAFKISLVAVGLAVVASAANAATTQFDNRTAFEAAASALTVNDLNSFVADIDLQNSVVDAGDFTITGPTAGLASIDAGGNGITPVDGTAYIQGIGSIGTSIVLTFDNAITAFGVDMFGANNGSEGTNISINGETFSLPIVGGDQFSFFGLTSDTAFTTISFNAVRGEDTGFDNITFGEASAVPLPAAAPLLAGAIGLLGFVGYRRRTTSA